jgi:hypothetical protein
VPIANPDGSSDASTIRDPLANFDVFFASSATLLFKNNSAELAAILSETMGTRILSSSRCGNLRVILQSNNLTKQGLCHGYTPQFLADSSPDVANGQQILPGIRQHYGYTDESRINGL